MSAERKFRVLIAGGGVAGLEALLALRDMAGDRVEVTLAAPVPDFVYKPLAVETPFSPEPVPRMALEPIVSDAGATFLELGLARMHTERHLAELSDGSEFEYDAAVICIGAKPRIVFGHGATLRTSGEPIDIDALLAAAADHSSKRLILALPPMGSWPLPVYELALMAQRRAGDLSLKVRCMIVTPEEAPLAVFGRGASDAVAELLATRSIEVRTAARAHEDPSGRLVLTPGDEHLDYGALLALPELYGPGIAGLPADEKSFLPIDEHARVIGAADVYAAGDGTNFPIKHGGLGAQQADAAAQDIAVRAGAREQAEPFHPVIRGKLVTGDESLSLTADIGGGGGEGEASLDYLWWPPQKIAGRYLSALLAGEEPHVPEPPPEHAIDVEVALPVEWHSEPMALDPYAPPDL